MSKRSSRNTVSDDTPLENPMPTSTTDELTPVDEDVEDTHASEAVTIEEPDPKAPVELELRVGSQESKLPEKLSKEEIETSVKEKLARRTDSTDSNPFVPQTQLEGEVKEVAKNKGFPLSRGTEVGARLLARSKRLGK